MTMLYTTRPRTVEAVRWTGDNTAEVQAFLGDVGEFRSWQYLGGDAEMRLQTGREAKHLAVRVGSFIVRTIDGSFAVLAPQVMHACYMPIGGNRVDL